MVCCLRVAVGMVGGVIYEEMVGGASVVVQVMRKMVGGLSDGREVRWFEC